MRTQGNKLYLEMLVGTFLSAIPAFLFLRFLETVFTERPLHPVMMGICFAGFSLLCQLAAILVESRWQRLGTGTVNRRSEVRIEKMRNLILIFLLGVLVAGVAGGVLQLLYQIEPAAKATEKPEQYVFLIDNSGSMGSSDPNDERYSVFRDLSETIGSNTPTAVYTFTGDPSMVHPLTSLGTEPIDYEKLGEQAGGGTNIAEACSAAMSTVAGTGKRTRILLLTDGCCATLSGRPKKQERLAQKLAEADCELFAVGFGSSDEACLQMLSEGTGGVYYSVDNVSDLQQTMVNAVVQNPVPARRLLTGLRLGRLSRSLLYTLLRILAITVLGTVMAAAVAQSLLFDAVLKPILLQGLCRSAAAGLLTELLCRWVGEIPAQLVLCVLLCTLALFYVPRRGDTLKYKTADTDASGAGSENKNGNMIFRDQAAGSGGHSIEG